MSTITQRKKLSKSTWVMLIAGFVAVVVGVVLHFVGIINLSFLGDWAIALMMYGASSGWNAAIMLLIPAVVGALCLYVGKAYFIGEKVTTAGGVAGAGYGPQPVYPSGGAAKSDTETTIS